MGLNQQALSLERQPGSDCTMCDKENTTHPPVIRFESQWSHGDVAGMMVTKWEIPKWAWCGLISAGVWGRKGRQEALFQLFSARSVNSFSSARLKGHIQMPLCILWICGQRALYQEIRWNWMPQKNHPFWGCILTSLLQSSPERFLWWANWNTFYQLLFLKARTMCISIYTYTLSEKKCACRNIWQPVLLTTSIYV